jgi:hypothetical protein
MELIITISGEAPILLRGRYTKISMAIPIIEEITIAQITANIRGNEKKV